MTVPLNSTAFTYHYSALRCEIHLFQNVIAVTGHMACWYGIGVVYI